MINLEKRQKVHTCIDAQIASRVSFALQQNGFSVIRSVSVQNRGSAPLIDSELEISFSPQFMFSLKFPLAEIGPGASVLIDSIEPEPDYIYLESLVESVQGVITLQLRQNGRHISEKHFPIEILAKNQWGGLNNYPESIAAFSLPNDPAVDRLLGQAAIILQNSASNASFTGYHRGKVSVWRQLAAIWQALKNQKISYSLPPASFEDSGQKVRSPGQIMANKIATCLDMSLLAAACIEQAGLRPLLIFTKGHACAGCWIAPEKFASLVTDDVTAIRKRLALKEMLVFETTLLNPPAASFEKACEAVSLKDDEFLCAIDICRTREQKITPMTLSSDIKLENGHSELISESGHIGEPPEALLEEELPGEGDIPAGPVGRLDLWQRKLLDLSLRNNLLNFRAQKKSVPLVIAKPPVLEDMLADGDRFRIESGIKRIASQMLLDSNGNSTDALLYEQSRLLLGDRILLAPLDEHELENRLVRLYRSARSAMDEGGANILYLALGFLAWRPKGSTTTVRAPLILLPARLDRKNAKSGFNLSLGEDESRFNLTLLEMLRKDFGISSLDCFERTLPQDAHGLDIPRIWKTVRWAIRDIEGWELEESVILSTFSFAKYLMWQDLAENASLLQENDLVKHLLSGPDRPYYSAVEFIRPEVLDVSFRPTNLHCPLLADSSQLAAIASAAAGKDFVLIGPPGTGKSQTIANMIAQCLADKKTVLFVAEKTAALNVVYDRLKKIGLADFCLEMHSNKANKADVIKQLGAALERYPVSRQPEWEKIGARLQLSRDALNAYVEELHRSYPNGLTPYAAMGIIVRDAEQPEIELHWPDADFHDSEAYDNLFHKIEDLKIHAQKCLPFVDTPLRHMGNWQWSPLWQKTFEVTAQEGLALIKEIKGIWRELTGGQARIDADFSLATRIAALLSILPPGFTCPNWIYGDKLEDIGHNLKSSLASLSVIHDLEKDFSPQVRANYDTFLKLIASLPGLNGKYKQYWQGIWEQMDLCGWSYEWEQELLAEVETALANGENLEKAASAVSSLLETESIALINNSLGYWQAIAVLLPSSHGHNWRWAASQQAASSLGQLRKAQAVLAELHQLRSGLNGTYPDEIFTHDLKALQKDWTLSKDAWFWRRGKIQKQVLTVLGCTQEECEADLAILVEMASMRRNLEQFGELAGLCTGLWQGADSDFEELGGAIQFAERLRMHLASLPLSVGEFTQLSTKIELYIRNAHDQLAPLGAGSKVLDSFSEAVSVYLASLARLQDMLKCDFETRDWQDTKRFLMDVLAQKANLREASEWQKFARDCQCAGLSEALLANQHNEKVVPGSRYAMLTAGETGRFLAEFASQPDRDRLDMIQDQLRELDKFAWLEDATEGLWQGYFTDMEKAQTISDIAQAASALRHSMQDGGDGQYENIVNKIQENRLFASRLPEAIKQFEVIKAKLSAQLDQDTLFANQELFVLEEELAGLIALQASLSEWSAFLRAQHEAAAIGLGPLVDALLCGRIEPQQIERVLQINYCRWWIMAVMEKLDVLKTFALSTHEHRLASFRETDEKLRLASAQHIASLLPGADTLKAELPEEMFRLSRELLKKKRYTPLRQLLTEISSLVHRLTPCFLMSPLSVAQYLEPGRHKFDIVIFDEASQVPVWDAIGAMARGKRIVIAGDPKQLPPTNFFQRGEDDDFDDATDAGMESILDECRNVGVPDLPLRWHYRSRYENLIEFSNRKYYESGLVTFPAPSIVDESVRLHLVDGIYERGGSRSNPLEARYLVEDVIGQLKQDGSKSIGIVTFNMQQQQLIEDMLEDARRKYPELERHFGLDAPEPLIVKNLENIQGDERDIIYFSICYAPDKNGNLSMNFGALSREGGERRLNVAITRARYGLRIFSSIKPEQISLTQTRAAGAHDLRQFLEYAEMGAIVLGARDVRARKHHKAFEEAVAESLQARGWQVETQIGASDFGVDIAVFNPHDPDHFLAAIECDGAAYRKGRTARDRDRLHEMALNNLGWHVLRAWSTDWWLRKDSAANNLHMELNKLLAEAHECHSAKPGDQSQNNNLPGDESAGPDRCMPEQKEDIFADLATSGRQAAQSGHGEATAEPVQETVSSEQQSREDKTHELIRTGKSVEQIQLNPFIPDPGPEAAKMTELVRQLVGQCSPIHINDLARQTATGLGYKRYGKRIQAEVQRIAESEFRFSVEAAGTPEEAIFFWAADQSPDNFILPRKIRQGRKVEEISLLELSEIARKIPPRRPDPIGALAAKLGIKRLHDTTRKRLQLAWEMRLKS